MTVAAKPKKTILFVLDDFHIGGVTTVTKAIVQILPRQHFNALVLGKSGNLPNPIAFFNSTSVIVVPGESRYGVLGRLKNALDYCRTIFPVVRTTKVDTIHIATPYSALPALFAAFLFRIPVTYTFHGDYALEKESETTAGSRLSTLKNILRKNIQYLLIRRSAKIMTLSRYSARLLRRRYHSRAPLLIIPLFPQPRPFRSPPEKRTELLYIGRLEPRKGVNVLLDAAAILAQKNIAFRLTIAAPAESTYTAQYFRQYEYLGLWDRVRFIHAADEQQKQRLLQHTDALVVPSVRYETFGLVAVEALSRGIPTIVTPVGALPEILGQIDTRFIAKTADAAALAERISWYIKTSRHDKQRLRATVNSKYRTVFQTNRPRDLILTLYEN